MEVHPHTHTPRKKWTHYLWEFLMLFLAVFCGFLAENQREHMIEHKREKQFIQSLVHDIEMDTVRLNYIISGRNHRELRMDSLSKLINLPDPAAYSRYIYYLNTSATRGIRLRFIPNDGTMQQLKNAGNLRLIRDPAVRDSITAYDVAVRAVERQGETEEDMIYDYRNIAQELFDGRVLDEMLDENNQFRLLSYDPPFTKNTAAIFKLTYRVHMLRTMNKANRRDNGQLLITATNLLILLRKEYHLE